MTQDLCGPEPPPLDALQSSGYTTHVRSASEPELAGGFLASLACHRALQDAFCGLHFEVAEGASWLSNGVPRMSQRLSQTCSGSGGVANHHLGVDTIDVISLDLKHLPKAATTAAARRISWILAEEAYRLWLLQCILPASTADIDSVTWNTLARLPHLLHTQRMSWGLPKDVHICTLWLL